MNDQIQTFSYKIMAMSMLKLLVYRRQLERDWSIPLLYGLPTVLWTEVQNMYIEVQVLQLGTKSWKKYIFLITLTKHFRRVWIYALK